MRLADGILEATIPAAYCILCASVGCVSPEDIYACANLQAIHACAYTQAGKTYIYAHRYIHTQARLLTGTWSQSPFTDSSERTHMMHDPPPRVAVKQEQSDPSSEEGEEWEEAAKIDEDGGEEEEVVKATDDEEEKPTAQGCLVPKASVRAQR